MLNIKRENRRSFRIKVDREAACKLEKSMNKFFQLLATVGLKAKVCNIGTGGACIFLEDESGICAIPPGTKIKLEIKGEGKEPLVLPGKIVWIEKASRGINAGVYFELETEEEHDRFLEYLKEELKSQG